MLSLPAAVRIHLCTVATDMRKSFDSLAALAESVVKEDPRSGHLFVFRNRRGDRIKILVWDRDGFAIWMKRLEAGTFRFPRIDADHVTITSTELAMILGGVELANARQRPRYSVPNTSTS
jgi:transposase